MQTLARVLVLLLVATGGLRADESLVHARRAQALLGPAFWSRVIRIENDAHLSPYPRTLHALVFELAGLLWFYTDVDGTQSFSLHANRLEREKADFGPLLRDIEPGFARWHVVPDAPGEASSGDGELPNGCFIASVAAWQRLVAAGFAFEAPRLLSFYHETPRGLRGHTVLTYALPEAIAVRDPDEPGRVQVFPNALGHDALALANALEGERVAKARWVPVEPSGALGPIATGKAPAPPTLAALR